MGIVYLARERVGGRDARLVAIKLTSGALPTDPDTARRFEREARIAAALDHPNIVPTLAIEETSDGELAIVSAYVPGRTLRATLREEGRLDFERCASILRDLAAALAYAHHMRVVHRDVKPENVFLEASSGRALLTDFGISRRLGTDTPPTMDGGTVGTPYYMAPEQAAATPVDERADVYALGLVGWEMLAGAKPWSGESLYSVLHKQQHETLPSLASLRPHVPAYLLFAIERAIAKRPEDRWRDGEDLLRALTPSPASLPASWEARARSVTGAVTVSLAGREMPAYADAQGPASALLAPPESAARAAQTGDYAVLPLVVPDVDQRDVFATAGGLATPADLAEQDPSTPARWPEPVGVWRDALPFAFPWRRYLPRAAAGLASARRRARPAVRRLTSGLTSRLRAVELRHGGWAAALVLLLALTVARVTRGRETGTVTHTSPSIAAPSVAERMRTGGAVAADDVHESPGSVRESTGPATRESLSLPSEGMGVDSVSRPKVASTRAATATSVTARDRCGSPALADQRACLSSLVRQSDASLGRTYGTLVGQVRSRARRGPEPPALRSLRAEQRTWLAQRERTCSARAPAGRQFWGAERGRCLAQLARHRERILRGRLNITRSD